MVVTNDTRQAPGEVSVPSKQGQTENPSPSVQTRDALRVEGLSKSFRSGFLKRRMRGISDIGFRVAQGEVFALLGHNGAGKTTTINCILDLVHPDEGRVEILGNPNSDPASRRQVGYLPERPYFFEHLTGRELLQFYAKLLDVPNHKRDPQIARVLNRCGMDRAADRPLRKYSKGMLQRVGLAQTLLGDPQLLILDEPMSGLDPIGRREVRELLLELKDEGKTIILSSHIVPDVEVLADRVGFLRNGELIQEARVKNPGYENSYVIRVAAPDSPGGMESETVDDVDQLGTRMAQLKAEHRRVLSVEPNRSGLEDLFMVVLERRRGH